jgi:hypothetical protein
MPDLLTALVATSHFWWKGVKWGAQVLVDAGESILGDAVKKQTKQVLPGRSV